MDGTTERKLAERPFTTCSIVGPLFLKIYLIKRWPEFAGN